MISPAAEPTPQKKVLNRVLLISLIDSWSVIAFAVFGTLVTLILGDFSGLAVGILIGIAGAIELRGRAQLKRRKPDGMRLLVRSQVFLLTVILVYCASRLGSFDEGTVLGNLTPDMEVALSEAGIEKSAILPLVRTMFYVLYGGLAIGTLIFQGGMTFYYRRKTPFVTAALTTPPPAAITALPVPLAPPPFDGV